MATSIRPALLSANGEIAGGLTGALLALPTAVGYGLILAVPLGSDRAGILAALIGTVVGSLTMAALGKSGPLSIGNSSAVTLLLVGAITSLSNGSAGPLDLGSGLAVVGLCTVASSLLLIGMALTGFGTVLTRIPYPVVAGILNGTAILMLVNMRPYVLHASSLADWASVRWGEVLVALCVIVIMLLGRRPRWLASVPLILVAIVVASLLQYGIATVAGPGVLGPVLRPLPGLLEVAADWHLAARSMTLLNWGSLPAVIAPAAVSIAMLTLIETMTAVSALQDVTGRRSEPRAALVATAIGGLISGASGGMTGSGSVGNTLASVQAGGSTALTPLLRSAFIVVLGAALTFFHVQVPMAALAAVVIVGALRMLDLKGLQLIAGALRRSSKHRAELIGSAATILVVAGIAVFWTLVAAVGVGILLSLIVFATSMATDVVRRTYDSAPGRSRTNRNADEAATLLAEAGRIAVIEVEGAIFFGSVEDIANHVNAVAGGGGAQFVVLDMRRVTRLDLSGARRFVRLCRQFEAAGLYVSLAYVRPGLRVWDYLDQVGLLLELDPSRVFGSLDAALQAAESRLLARFARPQDGPMTARAALAGLGLGPATIDVLEPHLMELVLEPGEKVIQADDAARSMFLLLDGQLDVTLPVRAGVDAQASRARLATVTPGTLFGEMALLSGSLRSADVLACTPVHCLRLDVEAVERLQRDHPGAALDLMAAIAKQMERNLRLANMTIRSLEE